MVMLCNVPFKKSYVRFIVLIVPILSILIIAVEFFGKMVSAKVTETNSATEDVGKFKYLQLKMVTLYARVSEKKRPIPIVYFLIKGSCFHLHDPLEYMMIGSC